MVRRFSIVIPCWLSLEHMSAAVAKEQKAAREVTMAVRHVWPGLMVANVDYDGAGNMEKVDYASQGANH